MFLTYPDNFLAHRLAIGPVAPIIAKVEFFRLTFLILAALMMRCANPAETPNLDLTYSTQSPSPSVTSDFNIPDPCQQLKFVGELSIHDFRKLFLCLNHKGALDELQPLVLNHEEDTQLFVDLYNEVFGINPQLRHEMLALLDTLIENVKLNNYSFYKKLDIKKKIFEYTMPVSLYENKKNLLKEFYNSEFCKNNNLYILKGVEYSFKNGMIFLKEYKDYENLIF